MKKAQGLSLNVIIVAAIALIVLIVLWAIFTGRMGVFTQGLQEAEKNCDDICKAIGSAKKACGTGDEPIRSVSYRDANGDVQTLTCCCVE